MEKCLRGSVPKSSLRGARAGLDVPCGCTSFHDILSFDTCGLGESPVVGYACRRVTFSLFLLGKNSSSCRLDVALVAYPADFSYSVVLIIQ